MFRTLATRAKLIAAAVTVFLANAIIAAGPAAAAIGTSM